MAINKVSVSLSLSPAWVQKHINGELAATVREKFNKEDTHHSLGATHYSPPEGLECFQSLYIKSQPVCSECCIVDLDRAFSHKQHTVETLAAHTSNEIDTMSLIEPDRVLLGLIECIRQIEQEQVLSKSQLSQLKQFFCIVQQISLDQIPECFSSGTDLTEMLGVLMEGEGIQSRLEGDVKCKRLLCCTRLYLNTCLQLDQIYSGTFAREFVECLRPLDYLFLELGAGRAMLSAAVKGTGKGIVATDKEVPSKTFSDYKVVKKRLVTLLEGYTENKPIYLVSAPTTEMFKSLCNTCTKMKASMLVVVMGYKYQEISKMYPNSMRVLELSIPDYFKMSPDNGVQLLAFNHRGEQYQ